MAQIILKGKRADRWIGLGRNRIRELRRQKGDWLSQRVELPDGTLTAQKLGRFDRIMIEVRDPYIIQDVRGDFVLPKPYKPLAGGITGEPFLISAFSDPAELLDVDGEPIPRVPASEAYVPLGKYLYATYAFNIVSSFTSLQGVMCIDTDTGASRLIYSNYGVSSPQGLSFNSFAPLMQTDDRDYLMAFSFAARPADDEVSQQGFIALTKSNANEALIPIWPLLGTNDGYYDGIDIAYGLTNAGRGKVMWIQGYRPSYDGDGNVIHDASRPEVIVYSHPGTYHRKLLRDLPGVPDIRYPSIQAGLCYVGEGRILLAFQFASNTSAPIPGFTSIPASDIYVFKSDDDGVTWSSAAPSGITNNEIIIGGIFNEKGLCSLKSGRAMLSTMNSAGTQRWVYYTTDGGDTWTRHNFTGGGLASRNILKQAFALNAVYNKRNGEFVYCATNYEGSYATPVVSIWDDFAPTAALIDDIRITDSSQSVPAPNQFVPILTYFDALGPLLQGYPGELEAA
jgi:hypothetical protein